VMDKVKSIYKRRDFEANIEKKEIYCLLIL